jgi:hypothetical protein
MEEEYFFFAVNSDPNRNTAFGFGFSISALNYEQITHNKLMGFLIYIFKLGK